jgi:hypothetical protein
LLKTNGSGNAPSWQTTTAAGLSLVNVAGTAAIGMIPYISAVGTITSTLLAAGTSGYFLKSNGPGYAPSWAEVQASGGGIQDGDNTIDAGIKLTGTTSIPDGRILNIDGTAISAQHIANGLINITTVGNTGLNISGSGSGAQLLSVSSSNGNISLARFQSTATEGSNPLVQVLSTNPNGNAFKVQVNASNRTDAVMSISSSSLDKPLLLLSGAGNITAISLSTPHSLETNGIKAYAEASRSATKTFATDGTIVDIGSGGGGGGDYLPLGGGELERTTDNTMATLFVTGFNALVESKALDVYGKSNFVGTINIQADSIGSSVGSVLIANTNSTTPNTYPALTVYSYNSLAANSALKVYGISYFSGYGTFNTGAGTSSDIRFKSNIVEAQNALEFLLKTNIVEYDFKHDSTEYHSFGVIAQEVEKLGGIFSSVVHTDGDGYKSVDYAKLGVIAIKAIQEQQKLIEAQNEKIESLTDKINNYGSRR